MTVSFRDARDFTIWFDAWVEGKRKLTEKEVSRLKEMVHAIPLVEATAPVPAKAAQAKPEAAPKPRKPDPSSFRFIIDEAGYVKRGSGQRVDPSEVSDIIHDYRGEAGDLRAIIWADDSTGLNGADLTIVGVQ
jgi:hypothetical protein